MASSPVDSRTTLIAMQGLKSANADAAKATERIATGLRVVRAGDDPAGIGKAAMLKSDIASFMQAKKNINLAVGDMQKVTDGLNGILDYLSEMRTIAIAAASETDEGVRAAYNTQFQELAQGISDIAENIEFADKKVLGANAGNITVQVGIATTSIKTLTFTSASAGALNLAAATTNVTSGNASAQTAVTTAIDTVSNSLAKYGGYEASLYSYSDMADSAILSKTTQYGDIMNADLALEATNLASAKIRQDAATAMMAQANSMNRNIADYLLNGAIG
jgi:flagellin